MLKGKLLSLEWWMKILGVFAAFGILLILAGRIIKLKMMVLVGACLGLPLLILGAVFLVVGVPYILLGARSKRRNTGGS